MSFGIKDQNIKSRKSVIIRNRYEYIAFAVDRSVETAIKVLDILMETILSSLQLSLIF